MSNLATVESAMITACQAALGATVRKIDSLPGAWSVDLLRQVLQSAPAVYVAFLGGTAGKAGDTATINGRFAAYVCVNHALESQRRLGTPQVIGAYDILARIIPALHNLVVPDVCTLHLVSVDNLFAEVVQELGGSVYGVILEGPNISFDSQLDINTLDDFIRFHADYDLNLADPDNPVATDDVNLPQ